MHIRMDRLFQNAKTVGRDATTMMMDDGSLDAMVVVLYFVITVIDLYLHIQTVTTDLHHDILSKPNCCM